MKSLLDRRRPIKLLLSCGLVQVDVDWKGPCSPWLQRQCTVFTFLNWYSIICKAKKGVFEVQLSWFKKTTTTVKCLTRTSQTPHRTSLCSEVNGNNLKVSNTSWLSNPTLFCLASQCIMLSPLHQGEWSHISAVAGGHIWKGVLHRIIQGDLAQVISWGNMALPELSATQPSSPSTHSGGLPLVLQWPWHCCEREVSANLANEF